MPELVKIIDQYNWDVDDNQFAMILSMVMYPADNVRFLPSQGEDLIEIYVSGIIQTFLDNSILRYKDKIISNLLDEKENPLYVELGKILDKAFEWRKYLEKLNKQRPLIFDTDHTIQFQLDMNVDDFIEKAVNETLEYGVTDIYDIYGTFLPKMEKFVRSEVADVIEKSDFDQSPDAESDEKEEKPEFEHYDYILWKKERKRRLEQEEKLKVHDELNPDEDIVPPNPDQESEVETPPTKEKKRKLKRKKKK